MLITQAAHEFCVCVCHSYDAILKVKIIPAAISQLVVKEKIEFKLTVYLIVMVKIKCMRCNFNFRHDDNLNHLI